MRVVGTPAIDNPAETRITHSDQTAFEAVFRQTARKKFLRAMKMPDINRRAKLVHRPIQFVLTAIENFGAAREILALRHRQNSNQQSLHAKVARAG